MLRSAVLRFSLLSAFIDELENVFEPPASDPVAKFDRGWIFSCADPIPPS